MAMMMTMAMVQITTTEEYHLEFQLEEQLLSLSQLQCRKLWQEIALNEFVEKVVDTDPYWRTAI